MAITYPRDFLEEFPGWNTEFDLVWRQEISRKASGAAIVKDLGTPLWKGTWQSVRLKPNELSYWRAILASLENGNRLFRGWDKARKYPILYPNGAPGSDSIGAIATVSTDRLTVSFSGISTMNLRPGDFFDCNNQNLYQIMENSNGGSACEIRPALYLSDDVGDVCNFWKPAAQMRIIPGSINSPTDVATGKGIISFQGIQA